MNTLMIKGTILSALLLAGTGLVSTASAHTIGAAFTGDPALPNGATVTRCAIATRYYTRVVATKMDGAVVCMATAWYANTPNYASCPETAAITYASLRTGMGADTDPVLCSVSGGFGAGGPIYRTCSTGSQVQTAVNGGKCSYHTLFGWSYAAP